MAARDPDLEEIQMRLSNLRRSLRVSLPDAVKLLTDQIEALEQEERKLLNPPNDTEITKSRRRKRG